MPDIIDCYQYLWDLDRLNLNWLGRVPQLNGCLDFQDYHDAAKNSDVKKTVYMEVDSKLSDKQKEIDDMNLHCQAQPNEMLGMIASTDPGKPEFTKFLDTNSSDNFINGERQVLHNPETPPKHCLSPEFIEGIRELSKLRLLFNLCIQPSELQDALELKIKGIHGLRTKR